MSRNRKSARNKNPRQNTNDYQQLEARQMLTVDLGIGFNPSTFDPTAPFAAPNVHGDIGPNHIVQVVNGEYTVFNESGAQQFQSTLQEFFRDRAGADITLGLDGLNNPIFGQIQDARVVFDHDSSRWFVSAVVAQEDGSNLFGNDILLAISRTPNPLDGFQSVQFAGDTTGQHFNSFATLGVNGDAVLISTHNEIDALNTSVSIYAIPKADLTGFIPSATNFSRFENMSEALFGNTIQFATDLNADSSSTFGIGTFNSGTALSLIELTNFNDPMNPVMISRSAIDVPFYEAAPDGRQPNDVARLNNISPDITGNVVSQGGFLWTVHTVEGSSSNSAVRWYQIDETSGEVVNTGDIEDTSLDFLYPSIAVNEFGVIAVGFSGSGTGAQQNPGAYVTMGFSAVGLDDIPTVTFPQAPLLVQAGADNIVRIEDGINPFGEYSATRVDPDNPFSFFTFQEFAFADDIWGTTVRETGITDIAPVVNADASSNEVLIRRSATNNEWVEIVIDGTVTDTFEMVALDSLELNLMDGDDHVTIDHTLGLFATDLGFAINGGAGSDTLTVIDTNGHRFDITGDGSGTLDFVNTFTGFEVLNGSDGDDIFSAANSASDWTINGHAGNDVFDIGNSVTGNYVLNGMEGDDTYRIPLANFASIDINDSPNAENDSLVGLGTPGDDELLVNLQVFDADLLIFNGTDVSVFGFEGIENLDFDGIEGDDTFQIQAIDANANFFGGAGNDTFNVSSDAPMNMGVLTGIQGDLHIDGGGGDNRLHVSNTLGIPVVATLTSNEIIGFAPSPISFAGNFGTGSDGLPGIILTGSDLAGDLIEIQEVLPANSVLVQGGLGNDTFTVRKTTLGDVVLDGQGGADTYRTSFGTINRMVIVSDSGSDIGRDRFSIRATDGIDDLTINANSVGTLGERFDWSGLENLVLDARAGDDLVTVGNNATDAIRVILNEGNDSGIVIGSQGIASLRFDGNSGNDQFMFEASVAGSFVQARGGEGDDSLNVGAMSFARSRVDGEAGNDTVSVTFASRDSRRVNARDTGGGSDALFVTGTPTADRLDLFTQIIDREGEAIVYNENTESVDLDLLGSNDIVNLFGAAATLTANLGVGNDILNVHSTASPADSVELVELVFMMASGNDIANVFRLSENSRLEVFGQVGNDNFNVGSTRSDDNGNLNRLRGQLFVGGGADTAGEDTLQINDRGTGTVPFNYTITDRMFANRPGMFTRPFESFNFNDMEFVFASGNDGRNHFDVTPSMTTVIRVDGNDNPTPANFFGDSLNVNVNPNNAQMFNDNDSGFFMFNNGLRNVSFQEIELFTTSNGQTGNFTFDPSVFDFDLALHDKVIAEDLVEILIDLDI